MRKLTCLLLVTLAGCTTVTIRQDRPISRTERIYVSLSESSINNIVSSAIAVELDKKNLLVKAQQEADLILVTDAFFDLWNDNVAFRIENKDQLVWLSGTASSGGWLNPSQVGRDIGKKIIQKIQENKK